MGKTVTELVIDGDIIETEHIELNEALEFVFSQFPDAEIAEVIVQPAFRVVLCQAKDPKREIGELHCYNSVMANFKCNSFEN